MQLEVKPVKKRYSIWSIAGLFSAAGALVTICIFVSAISPPPWDFVHWHSEVILVICPPSFASIAMDNVRGMEAVVCVAMIAAANSAIYFVVGVILAIIWKAFNYSP